MRRIVVGVVFVLLATVAPAAPARAGHSWNGYHWAAGSYPINLRPVNSFSDGFRDQDVARAVNVDWNRSGKFENSQRGGANGRDTRRTCPYVAGSVRMCNFDYGATGWAGVAQIVVSGRHILRGRVKINDHYGTSTSYRRHVHCQEFGHILGLDHQADGNHSCMDDSSLGWDELRPNEHDYRMLARIYDHTHSGAPQVTRETTVQSHAGGVTTLPPTPSSVTTTRLPSGELLITYALAPSRG
jgi:hypothetical protein